MTAGSVQLLEGPKALFGIRCSECQTRPLQLRVGIVTGSRSSLVIVLRCDTCGRDVEACHVLEGVDAAVLKP